MATKAELQQDAIELDVKKIADTAKEWDGNSHFLYVQIFTRLVNDYLIKLDTSSKTLAIEIAKRYEYATEEELQELRESISDDDECGHGIDKNSCPAGCGDIEY